MTIEVALLISFVSMAFSVFFGLKSHKRSDTKEIQQNAEEKAETRIMLRQISSDVAEMKINVSTTREDVTTLTGKLAVIEQSVKSAHKRIDEIVEIKPKASKYEDDLK